MSGYPVVNAALAAGEDIVGDVQKTELRGSYAYIDTATTTLVKTGPGTLHKLRAVAGTLGNVTVYDNTSATGTVILPALTPDKGELLLEGIRFSTGLTIVTAAATVLAISYS